MIKCKYYKPYMDILKNIVGKYYRLEGCCSGGPLHILLDDDNYDINSIRFCMNVCFEALSDPENDCYGYTKEVYLLGVLICNEYSKMTLEERAVFDSYSTGMTLDCCGNCEQCDLLGEIYDQMKEADNHD